ncbi:flagellar biosynthetic protein FliQ [Sphingomonas sp. KRR8]|uniref:flagellar biosynthetic protein FliQ n=1 Tax=Sphingomonas sp. KRR8 TaxID=2942996 RepID=UPI00201FD582|nr:flagellar biosynthetic protein FliQ [Sphingomonas sp. KRR8]URD61909.1 flagellar biosynthetic protein FliQ [Sphingomonas sp. KRR8]
MEAGAIMGLCRAAAMLFLTIAGPLLIAALITGVLISLLQALTQVQEMTLTFVPKLLVMGTVLLMSLPLMGQSMAVFMRTVQAAIVHG